MERDSKHQECQREECKQRTYCMPTHFISWLPRAKMSPFSSIVAEKGSYFQLSCSRYAENNNY